jgi:hypothetical protein
LAGGADTAQEQGIDGEANNAEEKDKNGKTKYAFLSFLHELELHWIYIQEKDQAKI